jgi:hypothetical protein
MITNIDDMPFIYMDDQNEDPDYRDPMSHPYNYSPFLIWSAKDSKKVDRSKIHSSYSDRLFSQNMDKFNQACMNHFGDTGQYFDRRSPKKIEAFLAEFHGVKNLTLLRIEQHCNQATGFPLWRFEYTSQDF